jgi:hypothetical protein
MFVGKDVAMVTYGNEDVADGPRRSNPRRPSVSPNV